MGRPKAAEKMEPITLRLHPEAMREIERRAAKRNQTKADWLRDALTKALLRPEPAGQQPQAAKTLDRREVTPMPKGSWKAR